MMLAVMLRGSIVRYTRHSLEGFGASVVGGYQLVVSRQHMLQAGLV